MTRTRPGRALPPAAEFESGQPDKKVVDLPKRFSNRRPALRTLISRVLSASDGRPGRSRNLGRHDTRGQIVRNPAKSQTRLSPRRRAELVAAYQAGEPVRTIAGRFGVHRGTVSEFVRQAGVPPRELGLDAAGRARAASLYESGLTLAQVAEEVAASVETVRSAVLAEGGTIRPRGRVPRHHKALNLLAAN